MSRNTVVLVVVALCLAGRAQAGPAEISASARAVLEKAIESMGGDAALAKVEAMRIEGEGTWQVAEAPAMSYTSEVVYAAPDRMFWKAVSPGMEMAWWIDGDVGWSQMMGPPARIAGSFKTHTKEWLFTYSIQLVRPLLHVDGIRITGGKAEAGGTRVDVQLADGRKFVLTFVGDGGTFLAAYEGDMTNWDGRKARISVKLSEPKAFGDLTLPSVTEYRMLIDGKARETMRERATAIEWNPELSDEVFRMPEVDLVLMEASEKQTQATPCVALLHRGAYSGIGESIKKLVDTCQNAGIVCGGPVTAVYLNDPAAVEEAELETEIAVPVMPFGPAPKLPEGLTLKTIPAASVASMTAKGPYGEADMRALSALKAWIAEQGLEITGPPRILFFHHPELFVAEDLVSEVQIPVARKKRM